MERINFVRGKKPSTTTSRLRKDINEKDFCYCCKEVFEKRFLQVEHEIPICLGSELELYRLYCKKCHKEKNKFDLKVIPFFKKMGWLIKTFPNEYETPLTFQELRDIYTFLPSQN